MNEEGLGQVPSAARAATAAKAQGAGTAVTVRRAGEAMRAGIVQRAARADAATTAEHADRADRVPFAGDTERLAGVPAVDWRDRCAGEGTIKGFVAFDPSAPGDHIVREYNCGGGPVEVRDLSSGYEFIFVDLAGGLRLHPLAVAAKFPATAAASVRGDAGGLQIGVAAESTVTADFLPNEAFTVVIF